MFAVRQRRMVPNHQKIFMAREPFRKQPSRRRSSVSSGARRCGADAGPEVLRQKQTVRTSSYMNLTVTIGSAAALVNTDLCLAPGRGCAGHDDFVSPAHRFFRAVRVWTQHPRRLGSGPSLKAAFDAGEVMNCNDGFHTGGCSSVAEPHTTLLLPVEDDKPCGID